MAAALFLALPLRAEPPVLAFPVDCTLGVDCVIQNYVDRDTGPGYQDFTCGSLSYDGHKGTDVGLHSRKAMDAGVDVLAALAGRVRGVRDGMPDILLGAAGGPDLTGRECGNGVVIEHADGWETQYCHLKRNSIAVRSGQTVAAGTVLGQVGLSGKTAFPHLHFTLRDGVGSTVDPFDGQAMISSCGDGQARPLWSEPVAYRAGGILSAGALERVPTYAEVKEHAPSRSSFAPEDPALVAWVLVWGLRRDDIIEQALIGPNGQAFEVDQHALPRHRALQYRALGRKRPPGGWPIGRYRFVSKLIRGDVVVAEEDVAVEVE